METSTLKTIQFVLNGRPVSVTVGTHLTLLEVLRDHFHLYGARESCGQGLCGACSVLVDGKPVSSCLYLAAFADGAQVQTVEGLGHPDHLHPVQEAFVEASGFQCGFCTPGMVVMATSLLNENPEPDEQAIKHYLSGNLCRCAAYPEIIEAVKLAAQRRKQLDSTRAQESSTGG